jgi:hypothetical protein
MDSRALSTWNSEAATERNRDARAWEDSFLRIEKGTIRVPAGVFSPRIRHDNFRPCRTRTLWHYSRYVYRYPGECDRAGLKIDPQSPDHNVETNLGITYYL